MQALHRAPALVQHPVVAVPNLLLLPPIRCPAPAPAAAAPAARHERRRPPCVSVRVAEETRVLSPAPSSPSSSNGNGSPNGLQRSGSVGDYEGLYSADISCPLGGVAEVMRENARGVLVATPHETLQDIVPRLSKVTGMPVISSQGHVVGVISRKDIIRVRKAQGSMLDKVEQHMTSPAITINAKASVQEAADLMLKNKIRRLPVVDDAGLPVGILARSDIFKPLFMEQYTAYLDREVAAMNGQLLSPAAVPKKKKKITWAIKYLYDGDCAMCQSLKAVLERRDAGKGRIKFVNIASPDYHPSKNMGIEYEEAMETIHAIRPDGQVLYGTDALRAMFDEVGLGWATNVSTVPFFSQVVDASYNFLSKNRISLGGVMDALVAAKRVEMSKAGKETCADMDEECTVEW